MFKSSMFLQMLRREINIHIARKSEWIGTILLYVIITSLFPIALGLWPQSAINMAPIVIWVATLLVIVTAQENIFKTDFKLGIFDQMLLSPHALSKLLLAKILAHWLLYAAPLVLCTPLIALSLSLSNFSVVAITSSLCLGTLILSIVAGLGAALTVRLMHGGIFLAILILPLYVPVLILGSNIGVLSIDGIFNTGHFALLLALLITAILTIPLAIAGTLKVSMN